MRKSLSLVVVLQFLLFSSYAQSQAASVYVDIGPCMIMETDAERYNCYDTMEAQIRAAQAREVDLPVVSIQRNTRSSPPQASPAPLAEENTNAAQAVVNTPAVVENAVVESAVVESAVVESNVEQADEVKEFGLEAPAVASNRESNARVLDNDEGELELIDTISDLRQRVPGLWEVTLASGQVWNQTNSKNYRLREGMEVRVYPSPFGGSFRMSATNLNGFIQVSRVR